MAKRILNVTAEQYKDLETNGILECGHFSWMRQCEITHVMHPSRCKSIQIARTEYPTNDRMRLTAVAS
jgi:hypothetical protein